MGDDGPKRSLDGTNIKAESPRSAPCVVGGHVSAADFCDSKWPSSRMADPFVWTSQDLQVPRNSSATCWILRGPMTH